VSGPRLTHDTGLLPRDVHPGNVGVNS